MGSATNDARRARLKEFGADVAIDTRDEKWPDQVLEATGGKGVNLTVDMVSGPGVNQIMRATAVLGRIVNVGRLGGQKAEFDFDLHAMKRIDYIGVTFRTRSVDEVREIVRLMKADLWDAVDGGQACAADRPQLPARRRDRRATAHEGEPAFRENRAGDVGPRPRWIVGRATATLPSCNEASDRDAVARRTTHRRHGGQRRSRACAYERSEQAPFARPTAPARHFAVVPPSIGITVPVMKLPAGEASSSASPLISSGSPMRAIGIISANFFARSGSRRSRPPAMLV